MKQFAEFSFLCTHSIAFRICLQIWKYIPKRLTVGGINFNFLTLNLCECVWLCICIRICLYVYVHVIFISINLRVLCQRMNPCFLTTDSFLVPYNQVGNRSRKMVSAQKKVWSKELTLFCYCSFIGYPEKRTNKLNWYAPVTAFITKCDTATSFGNGWGK